VTSGNEHSARSNLVHYVLQNGDLPRLNKVPY
jgi:hypothetical protein